jgi:hypothetical protein
MDGLRGALTSGKRVNQSAAFTMFAVIAARGSGKIKADMCRRFSVLITHGRMDSMGDCLARRTWMVFPGLIKLIIRYIR